MKASDVKKAAGLLDRINATGVWEMCVRHAEVITVIVPATGDCVGEDRALAITQAAGPAFRELKDKLIMLAAEKIASTETELRRLGVKGEL